MTAVNPEGSGVKVAAVSITSVASGSSSSFSGIKVDAGSTGKAVADSAVVVFAGTEVLVAAVCVGAGTVAVSSAVCLRQEADSTESEIAKSTKIGIDLILIMS